MMNPRNALLTGASRGIGPYIARSLAADGYNLVLASRSRPELEALARELEASGTRTVVSVVDLTEEGAIETMVQTAERELGRIDVLVNNAGGDPQREFDA